MAKPNLMDRFGRKRAEPSNERKYIDKFIKLLAQEDLIVIRGNFSTASCDPKARIVKIPYFSLAHEPTAVLMSAHEVSHARNTPKNWYHIAKIGNNKALASCINIVEDIRIEKIIKNTYVGLVHIFDEAYQHLIKIGFFGPLNVEKMCFADMINVHAKTGRHSPVQITLPMDIAAYKYIRSAVTFEDVVKRAAFLYEYNKRRESMMGSGLEFGEGESNGEILDFDDLPEDLKQAIEELVKDIEAEVEGKPSRLRVDPADQQGPKIKTEAAEEASKRNMQDTKYREYVMPKKPNIKKFNFK